MVANNIFPLPQPLQQPHATVWNTFVKWLKLKLDSHDTRLASAELQSRHRARVTRATAQAVGNAAVSSVVWTAAEYNSGPWNAGVNPQRLTAPITGTYHIEFCAVWALNATGIRYLAISRNGAAGAAQWTEQATTAAWYYGACVSCDIYLGAGDYIEGITYQSSGGTLNIDPVYTCSMSMYWLGA